MRFITLVSLLVLTSAMAPAQVVTPVDGTWHLGGRVRVTACASRCATRKQPVDKQVTVANGDVISGDAFACEGSVTADQVAAVTTVVPAKHGWLRMKILDRRAFRDLMRICIGYRSLRIGSISVRLRVAADGRSFDEIVRLAGSVTVRGQNVGFTAKGSVHGDVVGAASITRGASASLVETLAAALDASN